MSVQALVWAMSVATGSCTRKVVLISLANCHNHHTGQCNPCVRTICRETELAERTVRKALADLEAAGLIGKVQGFRANGSKTSNEYTLHLHQMQVGGVTGAGLEPEVEPSEVPNGTSADAGHSVEKDSFDLLWDALEEHVTKAPLEKSPRAAYAKLAREMFAVGRTPEWVRRTARLYRRRFPNMELTVAALAKWGEELDRGKRSLTEGAATQGAAHGDDGAGAPSVSESLPPEENLRRMQELRAMFNGQGALVGEVDPVASHGNGEASSTSARSQDARHGATKRRVPPAGEPSSA